MDSIFFDFHGVTGALRCNDAVTLDNIRRDFAFFVKDPPPDASTAFSISLSLDAVPHHRLPARPASLCGPDYAAYDQGLSRFVDYHGRALAVMDFASESAEVFSEDGGLLHELGYLLVCSRAGFALDRTGLHRVHALGIVRGGRGAVVLLPSGGGKSTLALELLKVPGVSLLSEDIPLVDRRGRLRPFPLRLGLDPMEDLSTIPETMRRKFRRRRFGPKVLVDVEYFRGSVAAPAPPRLLVLGRRSGARLPQVRRRWALSALPALFSSLVVGWGTPQLAEFMVRRDPRGVLGLLGVALSRSLAAAALVLRARVVELTLGTDRPANARSLLELMETGPGRESAENG